jgi:hypothetical protein
MQSVEDFAEAKGITISCRRLAGGRPDGLMPKGMDHWECTLRTSAGGSMELYFSKGYGHRGKRPSVAEVLGSLQADSAGYENTDDLRDWCSEYGFDTDTREDEAECRRIYSAVARQATELAELLGGDDYEELLWNTEPE